MNLVRNLSQDKYCQFESSIQHEAQTHQLLALESSEEHSLGFDDSQITEEKEYIKQFIANPSKATLQNLLFDKSLIDKWENNEITAAEVTSSSQKESLDARSVIQANSIHKFITSNPSKLFAVVGTQHLFGEKGVVSQLRAKGWSVN